MLYSDSALKATAVVLGVIAEIAISSHSVDVVPSYSQTDKRPAREVPFDMMRIASRRFPLVLTGVSCVSPVVPVMLVRVVSAVGLVRFARPMVGV